MVLCWGNEMKSIRTFRFPGRKNHARNDASRFLTRPIAVTRSSLEALFTSSSHSPPPPPRPSLSPSHQPRRTAAVGGPLEAEAMAAASLPATAVPVVRSCAGGAEAGRRARSRNCETSQGGGSGGTESGEVGPTGMVPEQNHHGGFGLQEPVASCLLPLAGARHFASRLVESKGTTGAGQAGNASDP